ncbi:serine hydrolase domain-containing protein [Sandarakinorhabdus limnophila]|uniref:serine hydrolase domain-containing protein n=1 Tax=Sandarakinorhabdus limnophila TaxID=210512 RepID=UPI0026F0DE2D|nr:serine hydrolase domain-containing protein [Sandarakinorhabdus limnophila]
MRSWHVGAIGMLWAVAAAALAQPLPVAVPVAAPAATPALSRLTATDAEAWIDGYLPYALKRAGIPGAVVVIVKDGQPLFEKGYGTSNLATGAPVDPKRTLFRPGSVSKLFTWTAVMQQVEAGKIDLDADVNRYIDFKIPAHDGKPVTMRNIMTHTAGFEEVIKNIMVGDPKDYLTFDRVLKHWTPHRVFAPGSTPAYSNYATTLAGYVVQRVSGETFDDYIDAHILKPLGMANSTFRQPLPAALAPQMSKGYFSADKPKPAFELVSMGPAGALSATGDDMAKFMIAYLAGGAGLLKPETAALMHATANKSIPALNGMTLGFMESSANGQRIIGHGGDTEAFHTLLQLYPQSQVGLYISLNAAGGKGEAQTVRTALFDMFNDRYFPVPQVATRVDAKTAADHAALLASRNYATSRGAMSSFLAFSGLLGQVKIIINDDGTISIADINGPSGVPMRFRETAPFVWTETGGHETLAAVVENGDVKRWSIGTYASIIVFLPIDAARSARWLLPAFGAAFGVVLLTLLAWPFAALARRSHGTAFPLSGVRATGYRVSRAAALLAVIAAAALAWPFITLGNGLDGIATLSHATGLLIGMAALVLAGWIGGLLAAGYNLYAVLTHPSGWFAKLWSVLLVLAFAVLAYVAVTYNLVNFATDF